MGETPHHRICPECGNEASEVVHTEFGEDYVERVRNCDNCPTEWTVSYVDPVQTEVHQYE